MAVVVGSQLLVDSENSTRMPTYTDRTISFFLEGRQE